MRAVLRQHVVIVLLVAFCVIGAVAGLIALEHRYGPIDPTDPGWKALVLNDLATPVRVRNSVEDLPISPRDSEIFVPPGPGQLHVTYQVTDPAGHRLGCLAVDLDREHTVTVLVSSMHPC